jgi:two-component system chemotaxis response regulator CheY
MDRILIIDDDDLMLAVLGEILELGGYEVAMANSGERGLELFNSLSPALVITDLIMPHTDGVHVIAEVRRRSPDVSIIAISGTPRIDTMGEAVHADANRIIAKPFDQDEILDAVAELLQFTAKTA